jgi:hypothetical protein
LPFCEAAPSRVERYWFAELVSLAPVLLRSALLAGWGWLAEPVVEALPVLWSARAGVVVACGPALPPGSPVGLAAYAGALTVSPSSTPTPRSTQSRIRPGWVERGVVMVCRSPCSSFGKGTWTEQPPE